VHRIEFRDVVVRYGKESVLHGLSLEIEPSEFVALLGPSGCGKTTMLRVLAGFVEYGGTVRLDGTPIDAIPSHRRGIGVVFQDYALFPHKTVAENIGFGLRMRKAPAAEIAARVAEMIDLLRLNGLADRFPNQLSGGQQQRVALARAIAINPAVLLLDEPLSALDKKLREEMQIELRQLQRRIGITTVFVTHDQDEALALADRIAVMDGGRIRQIGRPTEIYERPADRFVADFIGRSNLFPVTVVAREGSVHVCRLAGGATVRAIGPDRLGPGEAAHLSVRPEKIAIQDGAAPAGGAAKAAGGAGVETMLDGTIDDVVFHGNRSMVRVRLTGGAVFACEEQHAEGETVLRPTGASVRVRWKAEDALLVLD